MEEKECRFTIIISAFNIAPYIERSINSVLNQSFTNYEIIVIDDKSTDDTLSKILKYKDRIKIIKNEKNLGLGAVRNIGIKNAKGEYIVHLDGDDTLYNNDTLKDINKLIGNNSPDIIFFGFQEIGGNNRLRVSTKEARLLCDTCFSVPSKVWRKEFLAKNNIEFVEDIYYEDMVYSIKSVILANETTYGDFPIFNYYRNRENSIMTKPSIRRCADMYKMLGHLTELYGQAPENLKPYLLSFIINETQGIPYKIVKILESIEKNQNSPLFPKRNYNMIDINKIAEDGL